MRRCLCLLFAALAPAAHAQFQLFQVNGNTELQTPPVFDFGAVNPAQSVAVNFRLRNVSTAPASVYVLSLAGSGFTLLPPPQLPLTLNPQAALDFTVQFQASAAGSYSAGLTLPGISSILTATVVPALTWRIPSTVDFGAVERGTSSVVHLAVENHAAMALTVPPIAVYGDGFLLGEPSPAGIMLQPQQSASFDLIFAPSTSGSYAGTLTAGSLTFALAGIGIDPPLPNPVLTVDLPQSASGQQGIAHVALDAVARVAGAGTLTLDLQGGADSTVAFAAGGRSVSFTIVPGDMRALDAPFQTGTTAGTLVFTATLGTVSVQKTVVIAPLPVATSAVQATRTGSGITVQVSGFDNTRTAGALAFTFFDRAGNAIPPAPIAATADFAGFFQTSDLGGLFLLNAVFPVNGDVSQVAAFEVQFTNSAGSSRTARTSF
jgi:hypothetical protein